MKHIDKKIEVLKEVINSMDPAKYLKFKFQDFCTDMFFSGDQVGAFMDDDDFKIIFEQVDNSGIISEGPHRDILLHSFSFGIMMFYSYVDFCLKTAYLTRPSMKRFCNRVVTEYFNEDFPKLVFEYYFYIKRNGNSSLEQETIVESESTFKFFNDLSEFQFSFQKPISENDDEDNERENVNAMGEMIKNSYGCYINTICLSFSTFLNYLNSLEIANELSVV